MATTYYKSRHITKGKTKLQTMKDGFDYGQNPLKTRNGELIKSYMCDHETAYSEFLLSKAKYKAITGREQKKDKDVLYYHKRQSFMPGEIDHDGVCFRGCFKNTTKNGAASPFVADKAVLPEGGVFIIAAT